MRYEVEYVDGRRPRFERGVRFARVKLARMDPGGELTRIAKICDDTTRHLVTELSQVLATTMYMRGDIIVSRETSYNDALYLVKAGTVSLFGRDIIHPFHIETVRDKQCFGDDVAIRHKRLRWYTAKATEVTQVHFLNGGDLMRILDGPRFRVFKRHINIYGTWIALKVCLVELAMSKRLHVVWNPEGAFAAETAALDEEAREKSDTVAIPPRSMKRPDEADVARTLDALAAQIGVLRRSLLAPKKPSAPPQKPENGAAAPTVPSPPSSKKAKPPPPDKEPPSAEPPRRVLERLETRPSVEGPKYFGAYVRPPSRSPNSTREPEESWPLFDTEIERHRTNPDRLLRADDPRRRGREGEPWDRAAGIELQGDRGRALLGDDPPFSFD